MARTLGKALNDKGISCGVEKTREIVSKTVSAGEEGERPRISAK